MRNPWEPIAAAVVGPFVRFRQEIEWTIPGAGLGALSVWADQADRVLGGLLIWLVIASVIDWSYGRRKARWLEARGEGRYDPIVSQMGMHSKIIALILVALLRGGEWILAQIALDTQGAAAVIVAVALCARECKSIDGHRIAFGGGPVPVLHQVLRFVERLFELSLGQLEDPPRRRQVDRDPVTAPKEASE